ncbi:MAG: hypothetical protein QXO68_01235 [Conexivisphaerales archaeon]
MDDPSMISGTIKVVAFDLVLVAVMAALAYSIFLWYPVNKFGAVWLTLAESTVIVLAGAAVMVHEKFSTQVDLKLITISVTFGVLLYAAEWLTSYAPSFVWYTPPISWIINGLLIYLPEGIIIAALIAVIGKPGSVLMAMIPFYIISMVSYFNPIWTPFYFAWALAGEIVLGIRAPLAARVFGATFAVAIADTFLVSQFMLFNFGVYAPPALNVLTGMENAIFALVGAAIGYEIGIKARNAWKP